MVEVAPYGNAGNVIAVFYVVIGDGQFEIPERVVYFSDLNGNEIAQASEGETAAFEIPAGTYLITISDGMNIRTRFNGGEWEDNDNWSTMDSGELVTVSESGTIEVLIFGYSNIVATFDITITE
jgi:hypothetical protein